MVSKKKRDWKKYNEELVRRGELLFDPDSLSGWKRELKKSNEGKEGARYRHPECLMSMLTAIHAYLLPYRQLEGFKNISNVGNQIKYNILLSNGPGAIVLDKYSRENNGNIVESNK